MAVSVLARVSRESRFARRVVDGNVHAALLAFAAPQLPDAPPPMREAQLRALEAMFDLGKTSEFKAALSAEPSFFPMLFTLRDCDAAFWIMYIQPAHASAVLRFTIMLKPLRSFCMNSARSIAISIHAPKPLDS